jgi:hypothetical protein
MGAISSVFPAPTDGAVVPDRSFKVAIDQQPVAVSARRAATAASTWWKAAERMLFSGKSEEPQRRREATPHHYRPEIDGLRALAVVSVVGFHVAVPEFSGGFVGVDIFFVISGFLITTLLVDELQQRGCF